MGKIGVGITGNQVTERITCTLFKSYTATKLGKTCYQSPLTIG